MIGWKHVTDTMAKIIDQWINRANHLISIDNIRMDKDSFIGPKEFVVGYSKAPEQLQYSARPICHSHTMTSVGREPATLHIATYIGFRRTMHCATSIFSGLTSKELCPP